MIVETLYGKVKGYEEKGCVVWRGIPYAKAPVGKLRFAKPQKPDSWEGIFDAAKCGKKCNQRAQQPGGFYQIEFYNNPEFSYENSEDCLFLNIWKPAVTTEEKLPVAIYVHGGAFMGGSGSHLPFAAYELAKKGVIIVTINYRLGAWGFLSHPLLARRNGEKTSGNYGLWDQIEALKWVRDNIEAFGGDKDNITLFGQSAGAMSLQILCLSPETEGLYHKMILESGGGYRNPLGAFRPQEDAYKVAELVFEELGVDPDGNGEKLDEIPEEELIEGMNRAMGKAFGLIKGIPFVPVIDDEILIDDGNKLMEQNAFHKIPYILGANKNDITMEQATDLSQKNNPMQKANIDLAAMINACGNGAKAYTYFFQRQLPGDESGAFHSGELWYVFGSLDYCWRKPYFTQEDYTIAENMMNWWSSFMKTGEPGSGWTTDEVCVIG